MLVLLVEDDAIVCLTVGEFLRGAGFEVLEAADAANAAEALNATEDAAWRISVLVTDLDLGPGPDGLALAAMLRARLSTLPVICATGSPERLEGAVHVRPGQVFVKPFDMDALVRAVRVLEARRAGRPRARPVEIRSRASRVLGPEIA